MKLLRRFVTALFAGPYSYRYLRGLVFGGVRTRPVAEALDLRPGESVLDVGCGTGEYSILVSDPRCLYRGVDLSEAYILEARKHYEKSYRSFEVLDILKMPFPEKSFDKTLYLGVMHHLTEEENAKVLKELNRITRKKIVVMDLSPGGWHVINNILCSLDRGQYPRPLDRQCALLEKFMRVEKAGNYYVRTGIQRLSLITCRPV